MELADRPATPMALVSRPSVAPAATTPPTASASAADPNAVPARRVWRRPPAAELDCRRRHTSTANSAKVTSCSAAQYRHSARITAAAITSSASATIVDSPLRAVAISRLMLARRRN